MSPRTPHAISFGPTSLRHIKICEVGFPVFAKPFRVPTGVLEDGVEEVNVPVAIGGVRYCMAISLSAAQAKPQWSPLSDNIYCDRGIALPFSLAVTSDNPQAGGY